MEKQIEQEDLREASGAYWDSKEDEKWYLRWLDSLREENNDDEE